MSEARISVVIPTTGRDTLARAVDSAWAADEILVDENADGDNGYAARNRAIARATGTHIAFIDDDDAFEASAIRLFREAACERPVIFRMRYAATGEVLWKEPQLVFCNVGTPMFLVPNRPGIGTWRPHLGGIGGDFAFISESCAKLGAPVWREEIVAVVRPHLAPSESLANLAGTTKDPASLTR